MRFHRPALARAATGRRHRPGTTHADSILMHRKHLLGPALGAALLAALAAAPASAQRTITAGQTVNGSLDTSDPTLEDDSHYEIWNYRGRAVTGQKPSEFLSDTGLQVLSFPVEQASETTSVAADPSQNTTLIVNSSGLHKIATDKLKVNACGAPIDAWQQSIEIRQISTSGDTTMTGTWGWATQYGALLVYEKVKLTGSTAGEYEATINQLPAPPPGIF
jgi:hypothetical protein